MTSTAFDSPTATPRAPEVFLAREVPPAVLPINDLWGLGRVDHSPLFSNGPTHRLLIPMLSPPSPQDEDNGDDSVESFLSLEPRVSLKARLTPIVRNDEIISPFLEISPMRNPPASKEKSLPSLTKCFSESFTTLESTWSLSDVPGKQSYDEWDNEDASLDDSIDHKVQEMTSEPSLMSYRVPPARPTPSKSFGRNFSAAIPTHIMVPEDALLSPRFFRSSLVF